MFEHNAPKYQKKLSKADVTKRTITLSESELNVEIK